MKVLIFGGTFEGRTLAKKLRDGGDAVTVCVTSDYARDLLPAETNVRVGALNEGEMLSFIAREAPARVFDATHPFAVRATENIRACAKQLGIPYVRISRPACENALWEKDVEWVETPESAAQALKKTEGNILLTTGSHTLSTYLSVLPGERIFARVLPSAKVLSLCEQLLLPPGHAIAMQGPFSRAMNAALYDQFNIRNLVSKDSGEVGGVPDKIIPALERGMHIIMIKRPKED